MCFSPKLLMDCILLLVLMPAVLADPSVIENKTESASIPTNSTPLTTTYKPTVINKPPEILPPAVGSIKVKWDINNLCEGFLYFSVNFMQGKMYLCYPNKMTKHSLGLELCEDRRCGKFIAFKPSDNLEHAYMIHDNLTVTKQTCQRILLTCKGSKELVVYKVILGLLLTLIIAVLLCRFAQPAYIALRKRFLPHQNRWIGPTQSQSVSYHRGQASHPNNNTTKRHSYPGLERLTVNPSREPSSNRNSDYDSYGG